MNVLKATILFEIVIALSFLTLLVCAPNPAYAHHEGNENGDVCYDENGDNIDGDNLYGHEDPNHGDFCNLECGEKKIYVPIATHQVCCGTFGVTNSNNAHATSPISHEENKWKRELLAEDPAVLIEGTEGISCEFFNTNPLGMRNFEMADLKHPMSRAKVNGCGFHYYAFRCTSGDEGGTYTIFANDSVRTTFIDVDHPDHEDQKWKRWFGDDERTKYNEEPEDWEARAIFGNHMMYQCCSPEEGCCGGGAYPGVGATRPVLVPEAR